MQLSLEDFKEFYKSPQGKMALGVICENLDKDFSNNQNQNILGYGFTVPVLERLSARPHRTINYFPVFGENEAPQVSGLGQSAKPDIIGEAQFLPFADSEFDKIICLHGIEESDSPKQILREIWRVLAPEGRLILIIPNRRGIWARSDKTPFGHGRPFSRSQLMSLLGDTMFNIKTAKRILYTPPFLCRAHKSVSLGFEKFGPKILPTFGGLLYFELSKRQFIEPPKIPKRLKALKPVSAASIFSKSE